MRAGMTVAMVAVVLVGAGCERIVSITVPEAPVQLVVEGRVQAVRGAPSGRQVVRLSTSAPFFRNEGPPPVRGAQVSVTDGTGRTTPLRESATTPGSYETDSLVAIVGARYTLRIRWDGDDYEAVDSLTPVAPIDSLYFRARNAAVAGPPSGTSSAGLRATIDTRDPAGVANYYLWDMFVNGTRIVASDTLFRFRAIDSDQFFDGRRLRGIQPHADTRVDPGQQVVVQQLSLTAQIYRYYTALNDQVNGDGSPFSVPPNSLRGNVANLTRPAVRALGYFMATEISERRAVVP